jgi:hypothetical protein
MSKAVQSKLDPFTASLDEWFGVQKLSLEEVREKLKEDGCSVSLSRLSRWWEARQTVLAEEKLLNQIATGARTHAAVVKQFGENPPPELQTLIDLHRVLIMQLSTAGAANPKMLELADRCMRTVMDYISGQTKATLENRKLELGERRVTILERKAHQADQAKGILTNKELSEEEKRLKMRALFGIS